MNLNLLETIQVQSKHLLVHSSSDFVEIHICFFQIITLLASL